MLKSVMAPIDYKEFRYKLSNNTQIGKSMIYGFSLTKISCRKYGPYLVLKCKLTRSSPSKDLYSTNHTTFSVVLNRNHAINLSKEDHWTYYDTK